jgi:hypothetical protein
MARKGEQLSGWADPEREGWRERVRDKVNSKAERSQMRGRSPLQQFPVSYAWKALLKRAAEARGMSSAAYARRAVSAFIAHDLGLTLSEVVSTTPAVLTRQEAAESARNRISPKDDGQGYGKWEVK